MFNKNKKQDKLDRYADPTDDLSNRSLKFSEWYLRHKFLVRKILMGVLIAWSIGSVSFGIFGFTKYFLFDYAEDKLMMTRQVAEVQNYDYIKPLYAAKDLVVSGPQVFQSATARYDFSTKIFNPNDRWVVIIKYKYTYRSGETETRETILLPKENRPVVYFGHESGGYPVGVQLVLEDVSWRSINPHVIFDVQSFMDARLGFAVENFKFTKAGRSSGLLNHSIEFDLINNSVYGYWEPEFYIEFLNGAKTTGLYYIVMDEFKAEENKQIDVRSLVENLNVTDVVVHPIINVFNSSIYMPVEL